MKKILVSLLLIFVLVGFVSCKSDNEPIKDSPSDGITADLNLGAVKNGKSLNTDKDTSKAYYDVRVSEDLTNSLFYHEVEINQYINSSSTINIKPLAFNQAFANSANTTLVELINILNSETEGLTKEDLGIDLPVGEYSNYLIGNLTPLNTIEVPSDLEADENDEVKLVVVYMPIYGVYQNTTKDYQNVYLMIPVYYAWAKTSSVSTYVGTVKNYSLESKFVEIAQGVWVLPSKSE